MSKKRAATSNLSESEPGCGPIKVEEVDYSCMEWGDMDELKKSKWSYRNLNARPQLPPQRLLHNLPTFANCKSVRGNMR